MYVVVRRHCPQSSAESYQPGSHVNNSSALQWCVERAGAAFDFRFRPELKTAGGVALPGPHLRKQARSLAVGAIKVESVVETFEPGRAERIWSEYNVAMNDETDMTLWLHDLKELFVEPDFDPFDANAIEQPGLELIANYIEARSLLRKVRVSLLVPADQCGDDVRGRVATAIARHVARRVEWGDNKIRSSRNQGLRGLAYAFVVVVVGLILYVAVLQTGNQIASAVAEALFIIVSWVAVWDAAESLFLNVFEEKRMIRVWQKLAEVELSIRPHLPTDAALPPEHLS